MASSSTHLGASALADAVREPRWVRVTLSTLTWLLCAVLLMAPLAVVFHGAFADGWSTYANTLSDPYTLDALRLTLLAVFVSLPINAIFGVAIGWWLARFPFRGRGFVLALLDLPFSVSPVVAGLLFVLLFGRQSPLGRWLIDEGLPVIFAPPGIILATLFVTLPIVAREVLAVMEEQGAAEEEAALTLGASSWQMFWWVTIPKAKWGLAYGLVLAAARAMGEFGAVSIVSGHIRGLTNTLPLHVEILYNEYHLSAAFAAASLLTFSSLISLGLKAWLEQRR
jgi:sulfate transport system permease protein